MEEKKQENPQIEEKPVEEKSKKCCTTRNYCYCRAVLAILVIIFAWWTPSWANIALTVLGILLIIGSGDCKCCGKKKK